MDLVDERNFSTYTLVVSSNTILEEAFVNEGNTLMPLLLYESIDLLLFSSEKRSFIEFYASFSFKRCYVVNYWFHDGQT